MADEPLSGPLLRALQKKCGFQALIQREPARKIHLEGRVQQHDNWLLAEHRMLLEAKNRGFAASLDISKHHFLDEQDKIRYAYRIILQGDQLAEKLAVLTQAASKAPVSATAHELTEVPLIGGRSDRRVNANGKGASLMGKSLVGAARQRMMPARNEDELCQA